MSLRTACIFGFASGLKRIDAMYAEANEEL